MSEANFIFEPEPYRLVRSLHPDTDVFRVARDVAELVLDQSVIEDRADYLGIDHTNANVPLIMQEALARTSVSSFDISAHVADGVPHTSFHLHDADRAGRIITFDQQVSDSMEAASFKITDSTASKTKDFPFAIPKLKERIGGSLINDWLEQQLYGSDTIPPVQLSLEELRDTIALFSSRQTRVQLGHAAIGNGGAVIYAMREKTQDTFGNGETLASRIYNVWITGRFNPAATEDAGLITLRTHTQFDGNNLFHKGNTIEYHVEADDVINPESMFLRGILQASSESKKTIDRFKHAHAVLSQS